ncbi:MAG: sigma 54-interacting transcriptional regulator, partial [Clostridia bacterium]|nr:sigma 54-interacting transcriptional regulator [Clostridia bacterium]
MAVNVVSTISGRCKKCYSCIRNCPAKAIKVIDGQAKVVPELCINCGHCVEVCSQNAKRIVSGKEGAREAIQSGRAIACLAPSFVAQFYMADPRQIISAVKELGFFQVWEVAFGARLVSLEYKKIIEAESSQQFIATFCPAVVNLVEKHYPELIDYLIPVVSPMIVLGRYLKMVYGQECRPVFIGPCIAKKDEAENPMIKGAVDGALTFNELEEMFEESTINPDDLPPSDWDSPTGGLGRLYPATGGFLKNIGLNLDPIECEVVKVEGQDNCVHFFDGIRNKKHTIKLADILFCKGCLSGPALKSPLNLLERDQIVAKYTKENLSDDKQPLESPEGLDLSYSFRNRSVNLPVPSETQIRAVLTELGKFSALDELNCGACGYASCREKAVAVFRGLAENKMCLPFLVSNLESNNTRLRNQLSSAIGIKNMIGSSPSMERVLEVIRKVAPTESTVLIRGKSGTGKELVAQALHQKSLRVEKNFISINCAALPENLLESELFGHTKGAFTGAVSEKKGLFEEAHGGTLFLDEIGDISINLQAKLLRFLQEGEFLRIGETIPRRCNVRIIAATNQNLEELIVQKKFREDLFYRLNVVTIFLPDLKKRKDDIPILVKHFIDKYNRKHNKNVLSVNKDAMISLTEYD